MSISALLAGTGKVRFDDAEVAGDSIEYGGDTAGAVSNGCVSLLSAWVDSVAHNFYGRFPDGVVVLTGGDAIKLRPFITVRHENGR